MRTLHVIVLGTLAAANLVGRALAQDAEPKARPLKARVVDGITWKASGRNGAVVAGGAPAAAAGLAILKQDGNAADAAVATILALSVTDASLFCFGGEVPIMVFDAKRDRIDVIAGQGVAPRLATPEYFAKYPVLPISGLDVAAVPAALDACVVTLQHYGTKRFADVAQPTLALLAAHEQPWHADLERTLRRLIEAEQTTNDRELGLRRVSDLFYRGAIAREIDAWCRANGGLLRYEDLANHVTRIEEPVVADYRGYTVAKCGAWTQGPALLQTLQILEGCDLAANSALSAETIHTSVEAMKLGLADRDLYYADPLFHQVPLALLLDPRYAAKRRTLIDPARASQELRPGDPRAGSALLDGSETARVHGDPRPNDTTTCVVADRWGNVVAATPSGWSGVLVGDTGVWLGSRLQSFRKEPTHPNCIEPGKRPRITLTPTIVLKEGKPVLAVSVAGGDVQDQVTLQVLVNMIDFGMNPEEVMTVPRYSTDHHIGSFAQAPPKLGSLTVSDRLDDEVAGELERRGHALTRTRGVVGNPVVLRIDPASGQIDAAGCPRSGRHAAAY